jgi:hypothetical protein
MSPIGASTVDAPNGKGRANGANSAAGTGSVRGGVDDQYSSADLPEQSTLTFSTDAPMTIGPMAGGSKYHHRSSIDNLAFDDGDDSEQDPPPYDTDTINKETTTNSL